MRTDYSINEGWDYGKTILIRYPFQGPVTIMIDYKKEASRYANMVANRGTFQEIDTTGLDE